MIFIVRTLLTTICVFCFSAHAVARLGETEAELIKRFGTPSGRSSHSIFAQGKVIDMGPVISFRQDEWSISCDLVDGKCMRISYSKPGEWSEDQISLVLNTNTQGASWTETTQPMTSKWHRTWKRIDGSTATWQLGSGMSLVWDAYNVKKAAIEERAKVEAKKKPKI